MEPEPAFSPWMVFEGSWRLCAPRDRTGEPFYYSWRGIAVHEHEQYLKIQQLEPRVAGQPPLRLRVQCARTLQSYKQVVEFSDGTYGG